MRKKIIALLIMMRKRSIISLLLAFCLCFSMITPAMAAEVNAEAQIEAQAVSRLADFDFVQSADANEATFSIDGESIFVQNCPKLQPWTKSARQNWLM